MEKRNLTAILVVFIIIFIIYVIFVNFQKSVPKIEKLTEDDFKIIEASWNIYQTKYDRENEAYVPDESLPEVNWTYYCSNYKPEWEWSKLSNWHYITQQTEYLSCKFYYDGIIDEDLGKNISHLLRKGIRYSSLGHSLDYNKDHNIIICCESNSVEKEGEICDSITLKAKCIL